MPNTYSWVISQLQCYPQHEGRSDVVFAVHWRRQATDGTHTADVHGVQMIAIDSAASFTPFSALTKSQIESWLENAMPSDKLIEIKEDLDKQIEDKTDPEAINLSPPWAGA